jgi:hypothetical protein
MKKLLKELSDDRQNNIDVEGERIPDPNGNYDVVYQDSDWTVYHPKDYISSIHCANGARWCTAGGYQIPPGKVKVSQAKKYFDKHTADGTKLFYYIKKNGEKYALEIKSMHNFSIFDQYDERTTSIPDAPDIPGVPNLDLADNTVCVYTGWEGRIHDDDARESIETIIIPDGTAKICSEAFEFCRNLTNVTIPASVTSIGSSAFEFCTSLTSIIIPDSVTTIHGCAFNACDSLSNVELGSGVTHIGRSAFGLCKNLRLIMIPDSVLKIEQDAFRRSKGGTAIVIQCHKGSYAERYAQEYNIPVKYI